MSEIQTHLAIDGELCGQPVEVEEGRARVRFSAGDRMKVDQQGLVHGGFVFGLADHAAMLAVNDPNVVLGSAEVRFTAPVEVGQEVVAEAEVVEVDGKKHVIEATARAGDREVFSGTFTAFVTESHVLSP